MKRIVRHRALTRKSAPMRFFLAFFLGVLLAAAPARAQEEPAPLMFLVVPATEAPPPSSTQVASPASAPAPLDPEVTLEPMPLSEEAFVPGWLSLGVSVLVGTRPTADGLEPTFLGGFDLGFRLDEHVALGLRRTHVSGGEPFVGVGTSPYLELGVRPWERLDLYGQVGAALGVLVPTQDDDVGLELAPFVTAGGRFYVADIFSIALEGSMHVPLAGGLATGDLTLPALSIHFSGGLAVAFHLS